MIMLTLMNECSQQEQVQQRVLVLGNLVLPKRATPLPREWVAQADAQQSLMIPVKHRQRKRRILRTFQILPGIYNMTQIFPCGVSH